MNRPYLIHFHSILTEKKISVRAAIATRKFRSENNLSPAINSRPSDDFQLLKKNCFILKIIIINKNNNIKKEKIIETDSFGHVNLRISLDNLFPISPKERSEVEIVAYETSYKTGISIFLGKFHPIIISAPKKIVVSDFDKTLVDTVYRTGKEIYKSLTKPLSYFPTVETSLEIIHKHIKEGHHPFILSASPHFYERSIRNWLQSKEINDCSIFLKDYRQFFSFLPTDLFAKDIKIHGTYKISQLLNIVAMCGVPSNIVLLGDNAETDPLIYLLFARIILEGDDPTMLWRTLKQMPEFKLTDYQDFKILNRLYLVKSILKTSNHLPDIKIYIRRKIDKDIIIDNPLTSKYLHLIEFYT